MGTGDRILLAGATGLVGGALAKRIAPERLTVIARRPVDGLAGAEQLVADPAVWPDKVKQVGAPVAISCLGTTIRQAGSQTAFAAVDLALVLAFAKAAREGGARHLLMVSSVGARATSSNFYLRTKGQAEDAVCGLGFDRVDIFRPGLLRGERKGEKRFGESIMMSLSPLTDMLTPRAFDHYRSIAASDVAKAIFACVHRNEKGVLKHENRGMWDCA